VSSTENANRVDLVLEGGGVKGIGLVGALAVLEERDYVPQNVAGTSAGAIAAALIAAGYSAAELYETLLELDFESFKDETWQSNIPLAGVPLSVLLEKGIHKGDEFLSWIRALLAAKGGETFADLVDPEFADEPRYRHRLQVIASDITAHRLLVLPRDAKRFGADPDDLDVAEAIRMSMSIPIFFKPWRWRSDAADDRSEHLIVDGGVLSNFPVWLFDSEGEPPWPTFGLMLVEPEPRRSVGDRLDPGETSDTGIVEYVKDLVATMLEAHDRMYLESESFVRTIGIPTLGVRTTEFDLSRQRATALHESGRKAAVDFLDRWDFEAYKATFRAQEPPTRRELLGELQGEN
jgi:NTE family protein